MKKVVTIFWALLLFFLPSLVFAQNGIGQQNGSQNSSAGAGPSESGKQLENQNAIQIQNQGEDSSLQVSTQYLEQLAAMEENNNSSGVASQIRVLAQEQIQAQEQVNQQLIKLASRSGLTKKLLGPDYGAINSLREQIQANQLRVQQLEQLRTQLENEADQAQISQIIAFLEEQDASLEIEVTEEEKTNSLLGWLIRLFY